MSTLDDLDEKQKNDCHRYSLKIWEENVFEIRCGESNDTTTTGYIKKKQFYGKN